MPTNNNGIFFTKNKLKRTKYFIFRYENLRKASKWNGKREKNGKWLLLFVFEQARVELISIECLGMCAMCIQKKKTEAQCISLFTFLVRADISTQTNASLCNWYISILSVVEFWTYNNVYRLCQKNENTKITYAGRLVCVCVYVLMLFLCQFYWKFVSVY